MSSATALGVLLVLAGLAGLGFGLFALIRGGRGDDAESGGLGPIPEQWIHVFAGARMLLFGVVCLAAGGYFLYSSLI